LIQIYSEDEIFQFPIAVIIDKNVPRQAEFSTISEVNESIDICEFSNQEIEINLYDLNLNRVDGDLTFSCLNSECYMGESENGVLIASVPTCVNGYVEVRAEGYSDKKQLISTNEEYSADIVLEREKEIDFELQIDGNVFDEGTGVVMFENLDSGEVRTVAYPEFQKITLSEGYYNVSAFAYSNVSIKIPETKTTQCTEVAAGGISAFFGGTKEECYDIVYPETVIDQALIGGGKSDVYVFEYDLDNQKLVVNAESMSKPNSIDDLQKNFILYETKNLEVYFE
jgi:hypothetical protein